MTMTEAHTAAGYRAGYSYWSLFTPRRHSSLYSSKIFLDGKKPIAIPIHVKEYRTSICRAFQP